MIINKRARFYISDFIALVSLSSIITLPFLFIYDEVKKTDYYMFLSAIIILNILSLYFLINVLYDIKIQKYGYIIRARVIKIYTRYSKGCPSETIMVYQYLNQNGKTLITRERVDKIQHTFYVGDTIRVKTNGKKAILDLDRFEIRRLHNKPPRKKKR